METVVKAALDRLDRALVEFVDGVTKHKPTPAQLSELEAADAQLQVAMVQLQRHQVNNQRIQEMKAASDVLDKRMLDAILTLRKAWNELRAIDNDEPGRPEARYPVEYKELLSYARRISKTTMPPPGVTNGVQQTQATQGQSQGQTQGQTQGQSQDAQSTTATPRLPQTPLPNGAPPTPAAATPSQVQTPAAAATPGTPSNTAPPAATTTTITATALPENISQFLSSHTGAVFMPWPAPEAMSRGALASIQSLTEQGISPLNYDPAAEEARRLKEEDDARQREEQARRERDGMERQAWEERERMRREREARNNSIGAVDGVASSGDGGAQASSPTAASGGGSGGDRRQFQFASFEDDDDDDDDDGEV